MTTILKNGNTTMIDDRPRIINVRIGEMNADVAPTILKSVLGSCIGLILYDKGAKVGGLAHIFYPKHPGGSSEPLSKYADTAVPALIDEVLKLGARKNRLIAFMVGGNSVFDRKENFNLDVGKMNADVTFEMVKREHLLLMAAEVKKEYPVKIEFNLENGDLKIIPLQKISNAMGK